MRLTPFISIAFICLLLPFSACDCEDSGAGPNDPTSDAGEVTPDAGVDTGIAQCPPGDPTCAVNPCDNSNCRPDQACEAVDGFPVCSCAAGTTDDGAACVTDTVCTATTCNSQGTCSENAGELVCACDLGWAGDFCDQCDAANGYLANGAECTNDPCDLIECPNELLCAVTQGIAACECPAGTHLDGQNCSVDATCSPTTCAGNGTCSEDAGQVSCACEDGWAAPNCQQCDASGGFHADGQGGCTTNLCVPNPCTTANTSVCTLQGVGFECSCDAGFHDQNGTCVIDEVCQTGVMDSCNANGACDDTGGIIACLCDAGYDGDACDVCDLAAGYHDDGAGNCTLDSCLPNPCTAPNKTTCASNGAAFTCQCDSGYHADGMGGCTDDPCTPNLCAAMNQACRVTNNLAECFTPVCDDNNPCTDDALVLGVCQSTNAANGTSCSTTQCIDNQTCMAGACGGGAPRVCDDANPCTVDSCDAVTGCATTNDDTLVPDDGIDCTVDSCAGGFKSNTPSNSFCEDGLFCTGVETCSPANPAAAADGCLTTNIPTAPPSPGPCQFYGTCSEATQSFILEQRSPGSTCNDGVYCTTGDVCDNSGMCVGVISPNCGAATCVSTSAFPDVIDIPQGFLTMNFTLNGAPLPATSNDSSTITFWAVAKDTGVRHGLGYFQYDYSSHNLEGPYVTHRLIPGIYDILYDRYASSRSSASSVAPYGERILMSDVVITSGQNTLDIDIPSTKLTLNFTRNGAPLPATSNDSSTVTFWAVAKDTGVRHGLSYFQYDYSNHNLEGPYNTDRLIPGTYDIVFDRYASSRSSASSVVPYGQRVLIKDLVISGPSQTINIDIPSTQLTLNFTRNGAPLPATSNDSSTVTFWAVAKDTGVRHGLSYFQYDYSNHNLEGPYNTDRLIPGTYDILFDRYASSRSSASSVVPYGERVLIKDLVISGPSQTINIDIPSTELTLNFTRNGAPLPATSNDSSTVTFWAVAKDTGVRHGLSYFQYDYSNHNLEGPYNTNRLIPGTYDILFDRYASSRSSASSVVPYGQRVLIKDLVISGPSQTINIDIPSTQLTLNFTRNGAPLPATSNDSSTVTFWAVAKDTGVRHGLSYFQYDYSNHNLEGPYNTDRLIPGTYDILFDRYASSRSSASSVVPYGQRVLIKDLVISGPSQTVNIDIPSTLINVTFNIDGQPLPATSNDSSTVTFWAVPRDTGVKHGFSYFQYDYSNHNLEGPYTTFSLIPGTYDILYDRYASSRSSASSVVPYGQRYLGVCLDVQ